MRFDVTAEPARVILALADCRITDGNIDVLMRLLPWPFLVQVHEAGVADDGLMFAISWRP
jgi:hypothetical protein